MFQRVADKPEYCKLLVFLDTEFTDLLNIDLISIGMVSEDGRHQLYLERSDYCDQWCNSFVKAAVLPQLGQSGPALSFDALADGLVAWFATLPSSIVIACDSYTDWELLLDALGDRRPLNLSDQRYDLRKLSGSSVFHHAVVQYHEQYGPWHHSGHDAHAQRAGWLAWLGSSKS